MNPFYKICIRLSAKMVGVDSFGNQYFIARSLDSEGKHKRMVIYRGLNEPSKVPPIWKLWLHYATDKIPGKDINDYQQYSWQKPHLPNLTGTNHRYQPKPHYHKQNYQSWSPNKEQN